MEVDEAALVERISRPVYLPQMRRQLSRPLSTVRGPTASATSAAAADFVRRADDRPEAVATRLAAYRNQTAPILPYYRDRGILRTVDGMAEIDEVTRQIEAVLRSGCAVATSVRGPSQ